MSVNLAGPRTFIVGIAGGSASGKSSLAAALQAALVEGPPSLRVELSGMDRYFRRLEDGAPTLALSTGGELRLDRNHPESADNLRLVADVRHRCAEPDAPEVIIIEGLMALHVPEIRALLDLKLFVELDADVRALRRMLRRRGRGADEPMLLAHLVGGSGYYRECAKVGHALYVQPSSAYADLIIRGDANLTHSACLLAEVVRAGLTAKLREAVR